MTTTSIVHWRCDWCGATETTPGMADQAEGWVGLIVTKPALAVCNDFVREHLCPTCAYKLIRTRRTAWAGGSGEVEAAPEISAWYERIQGAADMDKKENEVTSKVKILECDRCKKREEIEDNPDKISYGSAWATFSVNFGEFKDHNFDLCENCYLAWGYFMSNFPV